MAAFVVGIAIGFVSIGLVCGVWCALLALLDSIAGAPLPMWALWLIALAINAPLGIAVLANAPAALAEDSPNGRLAKAGGWSLFVGAVVGAAIACAAIPPQFASCR